MVQPTVLRRSLVRLRGESFPAITANGRTWLFMGAEPVPVPSALLRVPRVLSWLLAEHLQSGEESVLSATVIPQMGCNLRCGYCFQNVRRIPVVQRVEAAWMTDETIAVTAAFIERQRVAQGLDGVSLLVFGGEPLLNPDRPCALLRSIQHLKRAAMVTNGVFLTPEVAVRLAEAGLHHIQITFDGARADHDKVRISASGRGTYDVIVDNLAALDKLSVLPGRSLRVNVTHSNLAGLGSLIRDLADRLEAARWGLNLSLVDDNKIGWDDVLEPGQSVESAFIALLRLAAGLGFRVPTPGKASKGCQFCSEPFGAGGMVVNADGRLYSCWETAGFTHMAVGDVWDGYLPAQGNEARWVECGANSQNQGLASERGGNWDELDWVLRELVVEGARLLHVHN